MQNISMKGLNKLHSMEPDVAEDDLGEELDEDSRLDFDEFKTWLDGKNSTPAPGPAPESPQPPAPSSTIPGAAAASCPTEVRGGHAEEKASSSSGVGTTGTGVSQALSGHLPYQQRKPFWV